MRLLFICAGLVAANFIYQAAFGGSWQTSLDRSFFQMVAVFVVWMYMRKGQHGENNVS